MMRARRSLGTVILPLERHAFVVDDDKPAVGDGDAMSVAGHVTQDLLRSAKRLLGIGHPFGVVQRCEIREECPAVRHRTVRTKGSLSSATAKLMVFKLIIAASKTWRRLNGTNQLPKVIGGVRFQDGIEVIEVSANRAA